MPNDLDIQRIEAAAKRLHGAIYHSPCAYSYALSQLCGAQIYCKFENLQMTGSFKERGARNKLLLLSEQEKRAGVIAASAGNHALGLAYHGKQLGIPVTVVMPKTAPLVKITNCRNLSATTLLHGDSLDEAKIYAQQLASERQLTYVPAFDDVDIIAGQGTIGLEILEDVPDVDAVIIPVGGGGLIAGVACAIKTKKPDVRIIAVEATRAPTLHSALKNKAITTVQTQQSLADGLRVASIGAACFPTIQKYVEQVVLVDESAIASAVLKMLELEKTVVEGAAATSLAALLQHNLQLADKKVVLVLCGGNIDVTVLARIIERGLVQDGRLCRFMVQISERPGSLARVLTVIAETEASIKEITHDRGFSPPDVAITSVVVVLETRDRAHISEVEKALQHAGISARLMDAHG
jgi:threonine dehydratase